MLSIRNTSRLLYVLALLCVLATIAVGRWGLGNVSPAPSSTEARQVEADLRGSLAASRTPPLTAYSSAWEIKLQSPLYDPPPIVVEKVEPPPPTPPTLRLTGTFLEPGNSRALVQDRAGATRIYRIGDLIDSAELSEINDLGIIVLYQDVRWQLQVGKEPIQQ